MISGLRQKVQPAKRKQQSEHRLAPMVDVNPRSSGGSGSYGIGSGNHNING